MAFFSKPSEKTDRELLEAIYKMVKDLDARVAEIENNLSETSETKETKSELRESNKFIQQMCMQLIENSRVVAQTAASKPSAVEAYLTSKNAAATQSTKEIAKSTTNGSPKLPG